MIERVTDLLLDAQNDDGGWGSAKGKKSNTETTSLAVMALQSMRRDSKAAQAKRGATWLAQRQRADGSWPLTDSSREPSWSTALAVLALESLPEYKSRMIKAAAWILQQEGNSPGLLAKLLFALTFRKKAEVYLNLDLVGWPWVSGTFSWVEPTSYCLMALKRIKSRLDGTNAEARIKQGELMIYDRMCRGGGWNYGNSVVLGEALWPYPDITAVALIALQDHAQVDENRQSLRALREMLKDVHSGLALSWSIICLGLYGEETAELRELLVKDFETTQFLGDNKSIALSLLALGNGAESFNT